MTGKGETSRQWQMETMKRMLLLSVAFHTVMAATILIVPSSFRHALFLPPIYQVNLVSLPSPPAPPKAKMEPMAEPPAPQPPPKAEPEPPAPAPQPPPKVEKPKEVAKRKPEPKQAPKRLAPKEKVASTQEVIQAPVPETPTREDAAKPKEREMVAPSQEAIQSPQPKTPEVKDAARPTKQTASVPSITAAVEARDFKFGFYTRLIERKIGEAWSPPAIEIGHELKEVVISFILMTTGKIEEIRVERSSGNTFLDQAALRAVYRADPLPPFPRGFREPSLRVHFSFVLTGKG